MEIQILPPQALVFAGVMLRLAQFDQQGLRRVTLLRQLAGWPQAATLIGFARLIDIATSARIVIFRERQMRKKGLDMDEFRKQALRRLTAVAPVDELVRSGDDVVPVVTYPTPVTSFIIEKIQEADPSIEIAVPKGPQFHDYIKINRSLCEVPESVRKGSGVDLPRPPDHLHGHLKDFVFDLHSADVLVHALEMGEKHISDGGHYLDFGCSTGRTVGTLNIYKPNAKWKGCDPVSDSIDWASANHNPNIEFSVSDIWPRLEFDSNYFDGVYAFSIWTHFSERAALYWLFEMHRILRPGAFLALTTKSFMGIARALQRDDIFATMLKPALADPSYPEQVIDSLEASGFFFSTDYHDRTASNDWGQTFISRKWLLEAADRIGFHYRSSLLCAWGFKQDLHILTKQ